MLIDNGAGIDANRDDDSTPLHRGVSRRREQATKVLVERDANVNSTFSRGDTPLHMVNRNKVIANLLLERSAAIDLKNRKGVTPLLKAEKRGRVRLVEMMKKYDTHGKAVLNTTVSEEGSESIDDHEPKSS